MARQGRGFNIGAYPAPILFTAFVLYFIFQVIVIIIWNWQ